MGDFFFSSRNPLEPAETKFTAEMLKSSMRELKKLFHN